MVPARVWCCGVEGGLLRPVWRLGTRELGGRTLKPRERGNLEYQAVGERIISHSNVLLTQSDALLGAGG